MIYSFYFISNRYYKIDKNEISYQKKILKRKKRIIMSEKRKRLNLNDFMNKKYGSLTIIGIVKANKNVRNSKVRVRCDCGKESDKTLSTVLLSLSACSKSCDLYGVEHVKKTVDKYINNKYGHLTIKSYVGRKTMYINNTHWHRRPIVRCECDCGRMIDLRLNDVIYGRKPTCGQCNLSMVMHEVFINKDSDPVAVRLYNIYHRMANHARTSAEFLSDEWFNDEDPIHAIHNFMNYCKPLYAELMNDGSPKHIYIHRIDINKPLGPDNVYFDHRRFNINYFGRINY